MGVGSGGFASVGVVWGGSGISEGGVNFRDLAWGCFLGLMWGGVAQGTMSELRWVCGWGACPWGK